MWYIEENEILSLLPSNEVLDNMKHFGVHNLFKKGSIIYQPNDICEFVYVIKKGLVRLARVTKDGNQISLSLLKRGMIFGEADVLNAEMYTHFAEAIAPSYICAIHKADFKMLLNRYEVVNKRVNELMYRDLKEAQNLIELLAYSDVKSRLVYYLNMLGDRFGQKGDCVHQEKLTIDLNLSQEQLAGFIGTSRETVNRIMKELKEEGAIDMDERKIRLCGPFFEYAIISS